MINNSFDYIDSKNKNEGFLIIYQDDSFKDKKDAYIKIKDKCIKIIYKKNERIFENVDLNIIRKLKKKKNIDIFEVEVAYKNGTLMSNGNIIDSYEVKIKK